MHGIEISETDHRIVITVDTDIVERWRLDQVLSLLDAEARDYPHIASMDSGEQEEIANHLKTMTPDDRRYTAHFPLPTHGSQDKSRKSGSRTYK